MMSAAKMQRLEREQTSSAQKVLECVPRQEAWTAQEIFAELKRKGISIEFARANGCLRHLADVELVVETSPNVWKRCSPRPEPTTKEQAVPEAKPKDKTTFERLSTVSKLLRNAADEIDEIALELESKPVISEEEIVGLRNLKAALKNVL